MSDTPFPAPDGPSALPAPDLPEGFGEALLARFGPPSETGGLTEYEGGVGINAFAQLGLPDPLTPPDDEVTDPTDTTDTTKATDPTKATDNTTTSTAPATPDPPGTPGSQPLDTSGTQEVSSPEVGSPSADADQLPPPPHPGGWDWSGIDPQTGQEVHQHYDDEEVATGLWLKAWNDSLDPGLRAQLAAVETGEAIPVSRAEYDQFSAWRQQQATAQRDHDLDQFEPEAAAEIKRLRDALGQQQPPVQQHPQAQVSRPDFNGAQAQANLTAYANLIDQAVIAYGAERNLTEAERGQLWHEAVHSGIIRYLADQKAVVSPTGQLLAPGDPREIAREALDFALVRNPAISAAVASRVSPTTPPAVTQPPELIQGTPSTLPASSQNAAQAQALAAKKARAASVASAPSAQVTPAPRDIASMPQADIVRLIEADLRADPAFASNGHGG